LDIKIEEVDKIPEWATTDWEVFKQIFFHIFMNAIKFNSIRGGITISFRFMSISENFVNMKFQEMYDPDENEQFR